MILKLDVCGEEVTILQSQLGAADIKVVIDGHFGANTERAVKKFQQQYDLDTDGIVGTKTTTMLQKYAMRQLLNNEDIKAAANMLKVDVATIKAVNKVESAGYGFLADSRPKILFERHVFRRELLAKFGPAKTSQWTSQYPDICNAQTGGYQSNTAEWKRYMAATLIDITCAQKACSWGLFQILGTNHHTAGFQQVDDFVTAMNTHEREQLLAFTTFIQADKKMWTALQQHDWPIFASRYNGAGYQKNHYDDKLKQAYLAFQQE